MQMFLYTSRFIKSLFNKRILEQHISKCKNPIWFQYPSNHSLYRPVDDRKFLSTCRQTDDDIKTLRHYRRLLAVGLFSSTLLLAWFVKKKKLNKLRDILEDCVKVPVNESLFKSKVSLYRYRGFIFPGEIVMSGVLQELPNFKFREDDIVVASFPKSGTTWIQEIVYMLTHNFEKSNDSTEVLETRFPYLEYPYPGIKTVSKLKGRRLIKTHLPSTLLPDSFISSGAKLIYIARNPRDTAVSYWHFMKLLSVVSFVGSFKDFIEIFTSDTVPYGPFYDHIKSYVEIENDNVLVIYYEDLKGNPFTVIKKVANFLQIPLNEANSFQVAAATSFQSMTKNKSVNYEHWKDIGFANKNQGRFLRKGEVGDWKNYFTPELLHTFEAWEVLNDKGLHEFKYEMKLPL